MAEPKAKRVRTCIGCGVQDDKVSLHRFVRAADGLVSFDPTGRKPGRGAYVCSAACLESAFKARKLQRALKCGIDQSSAERLVADMVEALGSSR